MDRAADFSPKDCSLPEARMEIVEDLGLIFITLADEINPIGARLAELSARLKNWKMAELVGVNPSSMDAAFKPRVFRAWAKATLA